MSFAGGLAASCLEHFEFKFYGNSSADLFPGNIHENANENDNEPREERRQDRLGLGRRSTCEPPRRSRVTARETRRMPIVLTMRVAMDRETNTVNYSEELKQNTTINQKIELMVSRCV